jgi:hypothetical protein
MAIVSLCLCFTGCGKPTVRVSRNTNSVNVDVATLGEYPTTISRIRLKDSADRVLWEVSANGGTPQIHEFSLKAGINSSSAPFSTAGKYAVLTPNSANSFELQRGPTYKLDLWGESGSPASVEFEFPK